MVLISKKRLLWAPLSIALLLGLPSRAMSSLSEKSEATAGIIKAVSARDIKPFDSEKTLEQFKKNGHDQKVMLMFDINGTLMRRDEEPEKKAAIKQFVKQVLKKLREDLGFDVYLNTGESSQALEEGWKIDGIGYVAEHGALISGPDGNLEFPEQEKVTQWLNGIKTGLENRWNSGWPGQAKMSSRKQATITFIGRKSPEFQVFFEELKEMLRDQAVVTLKEGTLIEITNKNISKGTAVKRLMHGKSYTLALAAGDDERDTEMLGEIREQMEDKNVFSLIITHDAAKETKANFRLKNYHDLLIFLGKLAKMKFPFE